VICICEAAESGAEQEKCEDDYRIKLKVDSTPSGYWPTQAASCSGVVILFWRRLSTKDRVLREKPKEKTLRYEVFSSWFLRVNRALMRRRKKKRRPVTTAPTF